MTIVPSIWSSKEPPPAELGSYRSRPPLIDLSWFLGTRRLGHVPVGNLVDKER